MTLDEAIKHAEEVANTNERLCETVHPAMQLFDYGECAKEHRQLAEWLKELKAYREQDSVAISNHERMIRKDEAIKTLKENICATCAYGSHMESCDIRSCDNRDAIEALEQQPCEDAISRQVAIVQLSHNKNGDDDCDVIIQNDIETIKALPSVTPQPEIGHCKDCKWWKDSDGTYRRGVRAESQCPINRREVFVGNGYCYMFELQESEDKE